MFKRQKKQPTSQELRRRRRRINAACAILLLAGAGTGIFALSQLLPAHGMWQYENRREYQALPELSAPCLLEIDIWYQGEAPQGIQVDRAGIRLPKLQYDDDEDQKLVTVWCDIGTDDLDDMPKDGPWQLSLVPMDNLELAYQVRMEPSREHAKADVRFLRAPDGKRWIAVEAAYAYLRDDSSIRAMAHLQGTQYQPSVMDWTFENESGSIRICIDDIIAERSIRDKEASYCSVSVMCGGTDREGEPIPVNERVQIKLSEWPGYDEAAWSGAVEIQDVTEKYLDLLDPHRADSREEPVQEPAAGG